MALCAIVEVLFDIDAGHEVRAAPFLRPQPPAPRCSLLPPACASPDLASPLASRHMQVTHAYPSGTLAEEELSDVAFCAFPDSMSMELRGGSSVRDSSFSFRVRRRATPPGAPHSPHAFLYGWVSTWWGGEGSS